MAQTTDRDDQQIQDKKQVDLKKTDTDQKKTDPNLTELKGFFDPKEKLEPEGTDNPDVKGMP